MQLVGATLDSRRRISEFSTLLGLHHKSSNEGNTLVLLYITFNQTDVIVPSKEFGIRLFRTFILVTPQVLTLTHKLGYRKAIPALPAAYSTTTGD